MRVVFKVRKIEKEIQGKRKKESEKEKQLERDNQIRKRVKERLR